MGEERFWKHAGVSEIKIGNKNRQVIIPKRLYKTGNILEIGEDVRWYVNTVTGTVLVTKYFLENEEYESITSVSFEGSQGDYKVTIPAQFFEDYGGKGGHHVRPEILEDIVLPVEGWLHFMYHDGMASAKKKSCYVFTENQFNNRFDDYDLTGIPRFT